jgi:hypothetical protein
MEGRALCDGLTRLEECVFEIARSNVAVDLTVLTFDVVQVRKWIEHAGVHESIEPWFRSNFIRTIDAEIAHVLEKWPRTEQSHKRRLQRLRLSLKSPISSTSPPADCAHRDV